MSSPPSFHLFERYGVELEYMIVDAETLDVRPITDEVLKLVAGKYTNEVERGLVTWTNELVLHVIELKSTAPLESIDSIHTEYQKNVREINALIERAQKMQPERLYLLTNKKCEAAIHLYAKSGFEHDAELLAEAQHHYARCDVAMTYRR